jgi:formylglycine-generating enzyme required for sulfatase activity
MDKKPNERSQLGWLWRIGLVSATLAWLAFLTVGCGAGNPRVPHGGKSWTNSLGMVFVPVKGTKVLFCIWATRVSDFSAFVEETRYDTGDSLSTIRSREREKPGDAAGSWRNPGFPQTPDHPVVGVNSGDAGAFCHWLTKREQQAGTLRSRQQYRLPTQEEMKQACSCEILHPPDSSDPGWSADPFPSPKDLAQFRNLFPWGSIWPPPKGAGNLLDRSFKSKYGKLSRGEVRNEIPDYQDGYAETSPVGSFNPNVYGLYDLAGNVMSWIGDKSATGRNVQGTSVMPYTTSGSAWDTGDSMDLISGRKGGWSDGRYDDIGFRCVIVVH